MSEQIYMEKLLGGVAVEWKALGEVIASLRTGLNPRSNFKLNAPNSRNHYITVRELDGFEICTSEKTDFVDDEGLALIQNRSKLQVGDVLFSATGTIGRTAVVTKPPVNWNIKEGVYAITPNAKLIDARFLVHLFRSADIRADILSSADGSTVASISMASLRKIRVPVPPLRAQIEIVRILDTFTELTTELTTRNKQYNHYRAQLFSFDEGDVEWKTLGEVTKKWYSGGTPTAGNSVFYDGGDIPWLRTQEVKFLDIETTEVKITRAALRNSAAKWIPANCVIVAISGATAGRSAINKIPLTTNQHCGCLEIDSAKALYRYVFHWVCYNYENIKNLGQGARGDLNSSIIKGFKIPIPYPDEPKKSLSEQARIVAILDKFNTLTLSVSDGLPREIELRQKQYAYYRDLLLSFPKPEVVA